MFRYSHPCLLQRPTIHVGLASRLTPSRGKELKFLTKGAELDIHPPTARGRTGEGVESHSNVIVEIHNYGSH